MENNVLKENMFDTCLTLYFEDTKVVVVIEDLTFDFSLKWFNFIYSYVCNVAQAKLL